jgi:uncharacterized protein (DUF2147 family)
MKQFILAAIAAAGLAGAAQAADPVLGAWKTQADDNGKFGVVTLEPCGQAICGTITRAYDAAGQPIASPTVGRRMIWDMVPAGGGAYEGGKVWAPDRDKVYNSRMTLSGDRLKVEGCIIGICRGQTWARAR